VIDQTALHRNENTQEIEGIDDDEHGLKHFTNTQSQKSLESCADAVTQLSDAKKKTQFAQSKSNYDLSSMDDSSALKQHQKTKEEKDKPKQIDY